MKRLFTAAALAGALHLTGTGLAFAQEQYLGEVRLFAFNFCPTGWAPTNGQLMQISQNAALFSLLGTFYGGNGRTTFGLPDLQGRAPYGSGTGSGQTLVLGENFGQPALTWSTTQVSQSTTGPFALTPPGGSTGTARIFTQSPGLAMTWCIAVTGIFPTRN